MWHIGIDLHKRTVVMSAVDDAGEVGAPKTFRCDQQERILDYARRLRPFQAVIEATSTYRWLYELLSVEGTVLLAHPTRLRLMHQRRAKTDKLDSQLLANLLRIGEIPTSYVPPASYQQLRDVTRHRVRMVRQQTVAKNLLQGLLARHNRAAPYKDPFGPRGIAWFRRQTFGGVDDDVCDELLLRLEHFQGAIAGLDARLATLGERCPQVEALLDIRGIGLYSALVIIGELGEVERFRSPRQVGAYAGLTSKVTQSGGRCHYGGITRQGSPWLRCVLVSAAMHAVRDDPLLKNFYQRIRKRSGAKKARVAAARKLAEISWKRLRRWHREHERQAA